MLQIRHFLKLLKINAMKDNKKVKNANNIKNNVNEKDEPDVLLLKYQFLALFL